MKNFDKRKVPLEAYQVLSELGVLPEETTTQRMINETKKMFKQLVEESTKISFLAFSGEGDSEFWNPLKEEIMNAISHGMKYTHCLGPVICTDENGEHTSIEAYKEYPKDVELRLRRTRSIYHWRCFTIKRRPNHLFYIHGECHHEPLTKKREVYRVSFERDDDPFSLEKNKYYYSGVLGKYVALDPIMDKVDNVNEIPTLTRYQLDAAYNKAKKMGMDTWLLSRKEILKLLKSKPL